MSTVWRLIYDHQIQGMDYGLFSSKEKALEFVRNNITGKEPKIVSEMPGFIKLENDYVIRSESIR